MLSLGRSEVRSRVFFLFQVFHEYTSLENFWKRYNKIVLDKLALDKEKRDLLQENTQLRAVLKQYLDGKKTTFMYCNFAS